ncbi:hypothetical protein [Shewanella sp.]|jgi:hypothetical protein|uniref:hypothetical protein n=1 Tax=Shewanella sp. TaxID=50422 RepID=UPI004047C82F
MADLSTLTNEELQAMRNGDFSKISNEKLQALRQSFATSGSQAQPQSTFPSISAPEPKPQVEPQRLRSAAQGLTLGFGDEIEALVRSKVAGQDFDKTIAQIRSDLAAYREDDPAGALVYEAGGSMIAPGGALKFALGKSPTLLRVLGATTGVGGVSGGVSALGTGEGNIIERSARVPAGVGFGAVTGPVGYGIGKGLQMGTNALIDMARRRIGGRGAKIVENEIQRIARETGMTDDEIFAGVMRGDILAENKTIQDIVRAYARGGGEASEMLKRSLSKRPEELRGKALEDLNRVLFPDAQGNVRRVVGEADEVMRKQEGQQYRSAFERGGVITQETLGAIEQGIKRSPGAGRALQEAYQAQTGKTPFFSIKDGEVVYDRAPTLQDAEILMRGLRDLADEAFRGGRGSAGQGFKEAEKILRAEINKSSTLFERGGDTESYGGIYRPVVKTVEQTRKQAAKLRSSRDSFDYGKTIFGQNADQVSIDFERVTPENMKYLRAGVMDAIRNKMATGNKLTFMKRLSDPQTKEGQILRTIYPQDELDGVLDTVGRAARSQEASGAILGGSGTAPTQMQASRIGSDVSLQEVTSAMTGNPLAIVSAARKMLRSVLPANLTDKQRADVAEVLVSEDPQLVLRALRDDSAFAEFAKKARGVTSQAPTGLLGTSSFFGGMSGGNLSTTE